MAKRAKKVAEEKPFTVAGMAPEKFLEELGRADVALKLAEPAAKPRTADQIFESLRTERRRPTNEEARTLADSTSRGGPRSWAPMRSISEIMEQPKEAKKTFVANDNAPVTVTVEVKGEAKPKVLASYANMAEFNAQHDFKTYPVKREESNMSLTLIHCTAKPWAGIIKAVPGIDEPTPPPKGPRKARDFSQPDAPGKPVTKDSSLGKILQLMIEGKHTFERIVELSGVEGGVIPADGKVKHRMEFVLFRQHGVGFSVADGIVRAVIPSTHDKKSIFKEGKK